MNPITSSADPRRFHLAKIYRRIMHRFGREALLRRMRLGWLVRTAHKRAGI